MDEVDTSIPSSQSRAVEHPFFDRSLKFAIPVNLLLCIVTIAFVLRIAHATMNVKRYRRKRALILADIFVDDNDFDRYSKLLESANHAEKK
ncbi:unnamed protein product [Bursaphelenchus okinawaensis]|uniref:Uncharacterized protein n=1 Tax=Bursaphelenchus okinawaensis TaxID=465554 RepID=A0A811K1C3_9BILA|nr:unnamed protein product [Bursaphelenchus okinawaensis]CAG9088544.1 unnamed protein product [Bursaphelenchus okinawaensis]